VATDAAYRRGRFADDGQAACAHHIEGPLSRARSANIHRERAGRRALSWEAAMISRSSGPSATHAPGRRLLVHRRSQRIAALAPLLERERTFPAVLFMSTRPS